MALDRLRTTNSCVPTLRNDTTTARLIEGYGLQEGDKQGHQQQEQCEEQTINDPGMGPNVGKAGELEEEESAGTALMPHPRPAAFRPFRMPERLEMSKKPNRPQDV